MKSIILIFMFVACAHCKLAKQSSELNYVITKPETGISSPLLHEHTPVNLVKYGRMAGHPIQDLSYGPNLAYAKPAIRPVLNYGNHRHYQPPLDLPPFELDYEAKKNPHLHSSGVVIVPDKIHAPYSINPNHHLKANPVYHTPIGHQEAGFHYISDHEQKAYLASLNSIGHFTHVDPRDERNPHYLNHAYSPLAEPFASTPINPYQHSYPPTSIIKYSSPVSTSYFMKINHIVPDNRYHHAVNAKTETPFFDNKFEHKLPGPFAASHLNYAPNFMNHHHFSIKK